MKKLLAAAIPILLLPLAGKAQMKLGTNPSTIDPSSILELESANQALYLSRVNLLSTTDKATVNLPKAGMMVYNTNGSITSTNTAYAANGAGIYYFDGTGWIYAGNNLSLNTANNGLTPTGNNIQLGGPLVKPTDITTTGANNLTVTSTGIGGPSVEANQGLNVLATSVNDGTAQAVALRGRINQSSGSISQARGVSGAATIYGGTINGTATGGYFNTNIRNTTLPTSVMVTGVSADAEATGTTGSNTLDATNALAGARFGGDATKSPTAKSIGVMNTAVGSTTANVGVAASATTDAATLNTQLGTLPAGTNVGMYAYNPATTGENYAVMANGNVRISGNNSTFVGLGIGTALVEIHNTLTTAPAAGGLPTASYTFMEDTSVNASAAFEIAGSITESHSNGSAQSVGSEMWGTTDADATATGVQAVGGSGYASGSSSGGANAMLLGLSGGAAVDGGSPTGGAWSGVGVDGYLVGKTTGKVSAGYFDAGDPANSGTGIGVVGTVNDATEYATLYSPDLAGKHVGVVAVNTGTAASDMALYTLGTSSLNGTSNLNGSTVLNGSVSVKTASASSGTYVVDVTGGGLDYLIVLNGATNLTLPASPGNGRVLIVKNTSAFAVTTSTSYKDNTGTSTSSIQGQSIVHLIFDGTDWQQVN